MTLPRKTTLLDLAAAVVTSALIAKLIAGHQGRERVSYAKGYMQALIDIETARGSK